VSAEQPSAVSAAQLPESLRLFIAVPVPESIKDEIERAQAELRRAVAKEPVRWTRREQFHLTLKFLGNVQPTRLDALAQAMAEGAGGFPPLLLRAEGVGFFPDARFPRVAWVGLRDREGRLAGLQSAIEAKVQEFTSEPPEKRFAGHVTLGRIKGLKRPGAERLAAAAASMAGRFFGEWTAGSVELVRSELAAEGARYSCLTAVPLK
jgi:RNA 2',3'-cyclic 3'-phosphodiesterase